MTDDSVNEASALYRAHIGAVPLPLTILQILAFGLGAEPLSVLTFGRKPAEPGVMDRPPLPSSEGVITATCSSAPGAILAALVMGVFFHVRWRADRPRQPAPSRLSDRDHCDLRRLRRLDRPHLAPADRAVQQPVASGGHRLRTRLHRRAELHSADPPSRQHRRPPPSTYWRCSSSPLSRVGHRRAPPLGDPPYRRPLSTAVTSRPVPYHPEDEGGVGRTGHASRRCGPGTGRRRGDAALRPRNLPGPVADHERAAS
ncbi:cation-translocating P-type ATPase C-terminal domain-containing protein [Actinomadura macrotermitis]|uniref:cation-translocating P-type ATPase C-terminal domain-containing protein n=1 Tax=Actinomadura macrotermitis TaxID=2585200 RepID=UPI0038B2D6ED